MQLSIEWGVGGRGAVAAFFVTLGRQWCCGGDTLGRIAQLERRLLSKEILLYKSLNYNNLKNKNGGSAYLAYFLACFSLLFPLRPQPCFKPSAVFKTWKQTESRLLLPFLLCRISTGYKMDG